MPDSFQKEKPPSRINLTLELETGDATETVELPLRLLVLGDFTGRDDTTPVGDRDVVGVTSDTFESVLASSNLAAEYAVPNRLRDDGSALQVRLAFSSLRSFEPEAVARQVPELRRMVAMRALLRDLRNRVVSVSAFRKQLDAILHDDADRNRLKRELGALVAPSDGPERTAGAAS